MTQKNSAFFFIGILLLVLVCAPPRMAGAGSTPTLESYAASPDGASHDGNHDGDLREQEQETIRKTFSMSAAGKNKSLEVDNVFGSIEVTGGPSNEVQLVVNKTIRAESKAKLEKARKEVTLDITQEGDALEFYVNGPFRCQCRNCGRWECGDCVRWND
ncbi:MAG TPA: hypothetical protein VGQ11_03380, partial [Candidatus Acidoferrales bacterium]|nr:hypothetical protein [Candidatus Acidoferrales bacterium]